VAGVTVRVTGLAAEVDVFASDAATDRLTVNGPAGDDTLSGGGTLATLMLLTMTAAQATTS